MDQQFQSTFLRDGQWVTESVNVQGALKSMNSPPVQKPRLLKAPECGLLTRTVVESQLAHFILPVRLRSLHHIDVAFVGDHYVQIRELRDDGQLHDIFRKNDFGSRIRNATVIGNLPDDLKAKDETNEEPLSPAIKPEDGDVNMVDYNDQGVPQSTSASVSVLPPQMLALVLDNGDTIFLYLPKQPDGLLDFAHSRFSSPSKDLAYPGFHVAMDPSSRYLALGCSDKCVVVHELKSMEELDKQVQRGEELTPVTSYRLRSVQGVINKMEFLFPRYGDNEHVILLLIVTRNGQSRMVTYDWTLGDNLRDVMADEKRGLPMPPQHQMPVFLIPLKVSTSFILVSERRMAVCTDLLHGSPAWQEFNIEDRPTTTSYHGRGQPLWAAWARPYRLASYFETADCFYIAREDGVVHYVEADSDHSVSESIYMDRLDCNISAAFACLWDRVTDVLVIGGDSGPGGIWKVAARKSFESLGTLPNWSPVVDFVTTDEFTRWNQETGVVGTQMVPWRDRQPSKPDRVFSTSGRGTKGTITEYRYGLQAKIGLEMECGLGVMQSWLLPRRSADSNGFTLLLSMPDQTTVVHLSEDYTQEEQADTTTPTYDDTARTLAAAVFQDMAIQVTEKSIILVGETSRSRIPYSEFEHISATSILDAVICDDYIALSTHNSHLQFMIHVLRIQEAATPWVSVVQSFQVGAEVTCLSLCRLREHTVELLAGLWQGSRPLLARARIGGDRFDDLEKFDPYTFSLLPSDQVDGTPANLDRLDSIASCIHGEGQVIVMGFRIGEVVTVSLDQTGILRWKRNERLGFSAAKVCVASDPGERPMVLVSVDSELLLMTNLDMATISKVGVVGIKHRVWPVDASNLGARTPAVDSVRVLPMNLLSSERDNTMSMMMLSETRVLFTQMHLQPGPAHRHMPVTGTPTKILYSHYLKCLVVAVIRKDQPALMFLDPDSGEDLGMPTDRHNAAVEYIGGLGKPGEKIFALAEWAYNRNGNVWRWILVGIGGPTPNSGKLLAVSATRESAPTGQTARIRYWTLYKRKGLTQPVYSVLGHENLVIYCVGNRIYWDVLDETEKRLMTAASTDLDCPTLSLQMANGKLLALTYRQSLHVIDPPQLSGMEVTKQAELLHNDSLDRHGVHMIDVTATQSQDAMASIVLVSDRDFGVAGIWVPWQVPQKDCEIVFDTDLPTSIRAFRRGRTRPFWEQAARKPRYGRIAMTTDDAQILGVSMDGSLHHFTLLDLDIWRVLRFIQTMAETSEKISPFSCKKVTNMAEFEPDLEAKRNMMHVDGDVLQRIYDRKALEGLIEVPTHFSQFKDLLHELDDGEHTMDIDVDGPEVKAQCFKLAYAILEDALAPVL